MVTFLLNDEHEDLRATVAGFARAVVAPVIGGYYERGEFPYEIVAEMAKLGLFGLPFPEEYGGMGGDYFALCLALHELARVDSSVAITLEAAVSLGAMPIYRFGSGEQRDRWLPDLCRGDRLAAFGLTEPGGGSDIAGGMRTTARLEDGDWVIDGSKAFITNSGTAITSLVDGPGDYRQIGRPAGDLRDHRAVRDSRAHCRAGVLEGGLVRLRHEGAGVLVLPGPRGEPAGRARPRLRAVPADPGRGAGRDRCAVAGLAAGCVDECLAYVRERAAFGRLLGHYQGIQFKIADMEARAYGARLAWYDAAARLVAAEPFKKQAAIAKLTCSNAAMDNARDATQIFGGYGFMNEFPVARFYRDAKVLEIGEGTSEVQRMVIARELGINGDG